MKDSGFNKLKTEKIYLQFKKATTLEGPSIKPGTWNIPEHPGTFRNIPEHPGTRKKKMIIIKKIKIKNNEIK